MKRLTLLGSTGSIGSSTLDVVRQNRDRFQVYALAAGRKVELLMEQILEFRPHVVVVATDQVVERLLVQLRNSSLRKSDWPELGRGAADQARVAAAPETEVVISAIVGVAGLEATYKALLAGKRVGLANKECLVSAGHLMMQAARQSGAELIPVDSEHNGAHQCLRAGNRDEVTRLFLTASGGPFRNVSREQLAFVTPSEALNHPTWKMGNRITIDSATLMNKGFEVIEACWLFGFRAEEVQVVVHPQSTVHAMVEYRDGSILAQLSATDMRMPIQYALTYPERSQAPAPRMDWAEARKWEFFPPDLQKFPLLNLAYECQQAGGSAACSLNAADEVAVEAFLQGKIGFPAISQTVQETLSRMPPRQPQTIDEVLEIDKQSRSVAHEFVREHAPTSIGVGERVSV